MITQEQANSIFQYKDGKLFWKTKHSCNFKEKNQPEAGYVCDRGYCTIRIKTKLYLAHRLIFLMHHGYMPEFIDHIDGNKSNNKIENLRSADRCQNGWNRKPYSNNKSGTKNVKWNRNSKSWVVNLDVKKQRIYCGSFKDLEFADLVAQEARDLYHQQFARHF